MVVTEKMLDRLASKNAEIERDDDELHSELADIRGFNTESLSDSDGDSGGGGGPAFSTETIVFRKGRPVLTVVRDAAVLTFTDPDSEVWKTRLSEASEPLVSAARAVGRIEVVGHELTWLGTGWLLAPSVVVTNRHVAKEFGRKDGTQFVFRQGFFGPMSASIDFLEEANRPEDLTFAVTEVLHIEDDLGPDVAFLRVQQTGPGFPSPIPLAAKPIEDDFLAVIGYPARDSRIPDQDLMEQIFGNLYDKKRLAPGRLTRIDDTVIEHDCTTLGGNSGSVVMSLTTGKAVGLHFAGRFLEANFAVSTDVVKQRLDGILKQRTGRGAPVLTDRVDDDTPALDVTRAAQTSTTLTAVVPLRITVEIANPHVDNGSQAPSPSDEVVVEGVASVYVNRKGFNEKFLGTDFKVPFPTVDDSADILQFGDDNESILKYEHFSVVMSTRRRLCYFSAVNIDGKKKARIDRTQWRFDPRIDEDAQIRFECYGDPPKFSRGHMTRREDPVWGAADVAKRANDDSMHVTNAVPQMQTFNAGIWLDLENYALQNARRDEQKISVITGPFFRKTDPVKFGVKIPIDFWKIIVFIHDDTGELTATGYTLSQRDSFSDEEFVFGQHKTAQRRIEWIEQTAGLSFNGLAALDPFREPEGREPELTDFRQIQFR